MSETIHVENGERVYPCRCGETHSGQYAEYDYGHHNCLHDATLLFVDSDDPAEGDVMCPQCGNVWGVRNAA